MHQYQKANIGILLGLLAALPAEQYNHNDFGFGFSGASTTGCACGLGIQNSEKFTVPVAELVPNSERSLFDRLLGRNKSRFVNETLPVRDPWHWAERVFSREAWVKVFDPEAFRGEAASAHDVTKDQVVARLTALAA